MCHGLRADTDYISAANLSILLQDGNILFCILILNFGVKYNSDCVLNFLNNAANNFDLSP